MANAESTATGRGPAHSLVPEHHTLDAGAKENHTAEVCVCVKESEASTATPFSPRTGPACPSIYP